MFFTGVLKISDGNTGHNNSLMETRLLASGQGINILFTGEWGGSENCSVRARCGFYRAVRSRKNAESSWFSKILQIYTYTHVNACMCTSAYAYTYAYTLFSSTYLVPGKVVLLRGPGQPYKALIKKIINNKKKSNNNINNKHVKRH